MARSAAVGMSGGMDSSVAAAALLERGFDVKGITLRICEGVPADVDRAACVAESLGIEHRLLDAAEVFERDVIDRFVSEYLAGLTPSPCVICNAAVKFAFLLEQAGCDFAATGHYAGTEQRDDYTALCAAVDLDRDQSYFLHRLTRDQISRAIFPLAEMTREEVADLARARSLPVVGIDSSQDICFVPGGRYAEFVEGRCGAVPEPGPIVDVDGKDIGRHHGIHRYTIGQRRGMGVAHSEPLYVIRVDPAANTITAGTREQALGGTCAVRDVNWIAPKRSGDIDCRVRIRYRHAPARATVHVEADGTLRVEFEEPQFAITPGQAAVLYDGDEVLAGGWIGVV